MEKSNKQDQCMLMMCRLLPGGESAAQILQPGNNATIPAPAISGATHADGTLAVAKPANAESVRMFSLLQGIGKSINKLVGVWEDEVIPYSVAHRDFYWWTPKHGAKGAASLYSRCKKVYEAVSAAWNRQAQQSHGQTSHLEAKEKQIEMFQIQCDDSGGLINMYANLVIAEQLRKQDGSPNLITAKDIAIGKKHNEQAKKDKKSKRGAAPSSGILKPKRQRKGVGVPGMQQVIEYQVVHQVQLNSGAPP